MTKRAFSTSLRAATLAAVFAFSVLPLQAEELTITHAQGETKVAANPQSVLVFDYAALDTLDALGIKVTGVPGSNLPPFLSQYQSDDYLKIGSLFEPDYEAVAAANADLAIVAGRSSSAYEQLSAILPTVDLSNGWDDFTGAVKTNSKIMGEIFGKQAEIDTMIADFDNSVADFKAEAPKLGTALVVLTNGGKVTAYGPGSRFGLVFDTLGLAPAVADVEAATHGEAISFEFILEANPDWLIVIDRDAATGTASGAAEQVLDNELIHQTKAWQNKQIVYVDPVRWYIVNGGLRNMHIMVDELKSAMLPSQ